MTKIGLLSQSLCRQKWDTELVNYKIYTQLWLNQEFTYRRRRKKKTLYVKNMVQSLFTKPVRWSIVRSIFRQRKSILGLVEDMKWGCLVVLGVPRNELIRDLIQAELNFFQMFKVSKRNKITDIHKVSSSYLCYWHVEWIPQKILLRTLLVQFDYSTRWSKYRIL